MEESLRDCRGSDYDHTPYLSARELERCVGELLIDIRIQLAWPGLVLSAQIAVVSLNSSDSSTCTPDFVRQETSPAQDSD
jgi:hypothetical protein